MMESTTWNAQALIIRTCNCCGSATKLRCSNCKTIYYCSKACRDEMWPTHHKACKPPKVTESNDVDVPQLLKSSKTTHVEAITAILWSIFLNVHGRAIYYGTEESKDRKVWFLSEDDMYTPSRMTYSSKDWYTTDKCLDGTGKTLPMTEVDFFRYATAGACSILTYFLAISFSELIKDGYEIYLGPSKITMVKIQHSKIKREHLTQKVYKCFKEKPITYPLVFDLKNSDLFNEQGHSMCLIELEDGATHVMDLSIFQCGINNRDLGPFPCKLTKLVKGSFNTFANLDYAYLKKSESVPLLEVVGVQSLCDMNQKTKVQGGIIYEMSKNLLKHFI